MNKKINIFTAVIFILLISTFTACDSGALNSPSKINFSIDGLTAVVSWNEVKNAQGYLIVLTSEGCGSGNRSVNTKTGEMINTANESPAANVTISGKTSISINLMASRNDPNVPMASALTAKIMSLGGTVSEKEYIDSEFSKVVKFGLNNK